MAEPYIYTGLTLFFDFVEFIFSTFYTKKQKQRPYENPVFSGVFSIFSNYYYKYRKYIGKPLSHTEI